MSESRSYLRWRNRVRRDSGCVRNADVALWSVSGGESAASGGGVDDVVE